MISLQPGQKAPDFDLQDQGGISHRLGDYQGKWVLLYFYPKDNTPGCTAQACQVRDHWGEFKKKGIQVLGISIDDVASHAKFSEKHQLPFTLLADTEKKVVQQYGVWQEKSLFGKKYMGIQRASFLINPQGKIHKIFPKVKPKSHAEIVLAAID